MSVEISCRYRRTENVYMAFGGFESLRVNLLKI